jgi:hypothetical protein
MEFPCRRRGSQQRPAPQGGSATRAGAAGGGCRRPAWEAVEELWRRPFLLYQTGCRLGGPLEAQGIHEVSGVGSATSQLPAGSGMDNPATISAPMSYPEAKPRS